ncbi:hypothetical protein Dimus_022222, partial [Dionaea muscipula]
MRREVQFREIKARTEIQILQYIRIIRILQVKNVSLTEQLQEIESEATAKQLKEGAIKGAETAKCKAAKEVIKSPTVQ